MPSYLSYKKMVAVVDAADDDVESWITVRGNHIPIMKGQSKEEAVKSFLAKKGEKESSQRANKPEHIGKAASKVVKQTAENRNVYKEATGKRLSEEEKKHQEIEAGWQKTLKSLEPQTAEQANQWIAETLASTEGFTSANFSKEDKEMLNKLESKFGKELAKMEEENALYEQAWQNVEEQERINNLAPAAGVFYTDFLSPSEMAKHEKEKEEKVKAEFERLKAEKEKSENKPQAFRGKTRFGNHMGKLFSAIGSTGDVDSVIVHTVEEDKKFKWSDIKEAIKYAESVDDVTGIKALGKDGQKLGWFGIEPANASGDVFDVLYDYTDNEFCDKVYKKLEN